MACPMVCPSCGALGSPAGDLYAALGLEKRLDLNPGELRKKYLDLSRLLHPDRQDPADASGRARAEELTAELNKAYKVLSRPESRAADWLAKRGVALREEKGGLDPEMAERSLEIQEAIEAEQERLGDGEIGKGPLQKLREQVGREMEASGKELEGLFARADNEADAGLQALKSALVKYRFIQRQALNLDTALGEIKGPPRAAGAES